MNASVATWITTTFCTAMPRAVVRSLLDVFWRVVESASADAGVGILMRALTATLPAVTVRTMLAAETLLSVARLCTNASWSKLLTSPLTVKVAST